MEKRYFTISEICEMLDIKAHTLRYWETEFPKLKKKTKRGSPRRYSQDEIDYIKRIKELIVEKRFTLEGAKMAMKTSESRPQTSEGSLQITEDRRKNTQDRRQNPHDRRQNSQTSEDRPQTSDLRPQISQTIKNKLIEIKSLLQKRTPSSTDKVCLVSTNQERDDTTKSPNTEHPTLNTDT